METKRIARLVTLLLLLLMAFFGGLLILMHVFSLKYQTFARLGVALSTLSLLAWVFLQGKIVPWIDRVLIESDRVRVNWAGHSASVEIGAAILVSGYCVYLAFFDVTGYRQLVAEDGIVEWASVLFWLMACVLVVLRLMRRPGVGVQGKLLPVLMAAFFFVCAGEEASWGQRVIGISTPEIIGSINVQNETNLHNMGSISVFSNAFFMLTVGFFLALPFVSRRSPSVDYILYRAGLVRPSQEVSYLYFWGLVIWVVIGLRFGTLGFHPFSFYPEKYYNQLDDEFFEMMAAYCFFVYAVYFRSSSPSVEKIGGID